MPIFTLQYLAWRVMVGLHQSVTISFLLVGHTKFAPDWCFGLFKQRFRRTFVSSLQEIADVVESSAHVNTAQLVGTQNGEVVVPVYDWGQFLGERFRKLPKIKSFQHFTFTSSKPGIVHIKSFSDSEESTFRLLSDDTWVPDSHELPQRVTPPGLSAKRQWYLYDQIREFCREDSKNLVCPLPAVPRPGDEQDDSPEEGDINVPPQPKRPRAGLRTTPAVHGEDGCQRQRHCGKCGKPGHTRRTCTT